jgi:phosphoglycolate phosphatase
VNGKTPAAVLFDLDGTLLDTAPDFARTLNRMLAEHGMPALPYARIRATVSHGARALVQLAFGLRDGEPGFEALRSRLLSLYEEGLSVETKPFDGVRPLLTELAARGIAWGVVTNKPHFLADPLRAAMGFKPGAAALVCPEHVSRTKPDPEPLLLACRLVGCEPESTVYVGDHARDIEAGRRAGMTTIAAAWGYLGEGESALAWEADLLARDVAELQALLLA